MKKIKYLLLILVVAAGCSDFLEESSGDLIKLKSIQDYKEFLAGETYQNDKHGSYPNYLDILTDDVQTVYNSSTWRSNDYTNEYYGYYTWAEQPEITKTGGIKNDLYYNRAYHNILICNIVEDDLKDKFEDTNERKMLLAECHFLRAQSYFTLVNLYAKVYDKATASEDLGIPINKSTTIDDKMIARSSVKEVYALINDYIDQAISLFEQADNETIFRPNLKATLTLASRIYLYQKEYQAVLDYTNKALENKAVLFSLSDGCKSFLNFGNSEILFSWGHFNYISIYDGCFKFTFRKSDALYNQYQDNDWRKDCFFRAFKSFFIPLKWDEKNDMFSYALRTSELYLNRAEAFANTNENVKAAEVMNIFKANRYDGFTPIEYTDDVMAIADVKKERRLEFAFEFQRWFDLRRYGMKAISHEYETDGGNEIFLIEESSNRFVLPFPQEVMKRNIELKQNPR